MSPFLVLNWNYATKVVKILLINKKTIWEIGGKFMCALAAQNKGEQANNCLRAEADIFCLINHVL
jgi:hypothetical protein